MTIAFDAIPNDTLVPLWWAEVKPAQTPYSAPARLLLMGHKWTYNNASFGDADLNKVYALSGANCHDLFGPGSMLDLMYRYARMQSPFLDIRGIAVAEDDAATTAAGIIEVTGTPSTRAHGRMTIWIADVPISIIVKPDDTAAEVNTALRQAINKKSSLIPATAIKFRSDWPTAGGTETDTKTRVVCKHKGAMGNALRIVRDREGNSRTLAEKLLTVTQFTGGTGGPDVSAALAGLGDQKFTTIVMPWAGTSALDAMKDFMDGISGRWSPTKQIYGHVICANQASYANQLTFAAARNDPHMTVLAAEAPPQPVWLAAAALGAVMADKLDGPPRISMPLHAIPLKGIHAPVNENSWFDIAERNALHAAGLATCTVDDDGTVRISRTVTTYKTNVSSVIDSSWRDAQTLYQGAFFGNAMKAAVTGAFPRAALTEQPSGITGFTSPDQIKDVLIHEYKRLEGLGLVENSALFAANLICEINGNDPNRVDVYMPADVVNQLIVVAASIETHLRIKDSALLNGTDVAETDDLSA